MVLGGVLGGLTTDSNFALPVELAQAGRLAALAWQLGLHLAGGMLMVALGASLVGLFTRLA